MTPQEKAKSLVSRFRMKHVIAVKNSKGNIVSPYTSGYVQGVVRHSTAIQSALLCVEMIILSNPHSNPLNSNIESTMEYWVDVRQEIEKLWKTKNC